MVTVWFEERGKVKQAHKRRLLGFPCHDERLFEIMIMSSKWDQLNLARPQMLVWVEKLVKIMIWTSLRSFSLRFIISSPKKKSKGDFLKDKHFIMGKVIIAPWGFTCSSQRGAQDSGVPRNQDPPGKRILSPFFGLGEAGGEWWWCQPMSLGPRFWFWAHNSLLGPVTKPTSPVFYFLPHLWVYLMFHGIRHVPTEVRSCEFLQKHSDA